MWIDWVVEAVEQRIESEVGGNMQYSVVEILVGLMSRFQSQSSQFWEQPFETL